MTTNRMTAAEFREHVANGNIALRGKVGRGLPDHVTDAARKTIAAKQQKAKPSGSGGKRTKVDGIAFPSKMEARVYLRLKAEAERDGAMLFRQVRYPLTNLAPREDGKPMCLSIDFELVYSDNRRRFIDAKAKRWKSRDWTRGKAAFEACYGHVIEECER